MRKENKDDLCGDPGEDVNRQKTSCQGECYFDKELQACGTCYRTLEDIKNEYYKQRSNTGGTQEIPGE